MADGVEDLHQLEPARYAEVLGLVREISLFVSGYFKPDKLNVACIGNQVRQMHIHVVGRSEGDARMVELVDPFSAASPRPAAIGCFATDSAAAGIFAARAHDPGHRRARVELKWQRHREAGP